MVEAAKLKTLGHIIMALGVGLAGGDTTEIDAIASDTNYAFTTEFNALNAIREKVRAVLCDLVSYRDWFIYLFMSD